MIEMSESLGRLLGLSDGDLVEAAIEYSFERLKQVELEPLTPDDFEVIERNAGYIEEQLLNQVGVFYDGQIFNVLIGEGNVSVRLITKVQKSQAAQAKCFYLTVDSELHIAPKLRPIGKKEATEEVKEEGKIEEEEKNEVDNNKIWKFRVQTTNDTKYLNKLILHSSLASSFSQEDIVLVKFDSRSKLSDLEFTEFLAYKTTKNA